MDSNKDSEKLTSFEEIASLLEAGDLSKFIGLRETEVFEAKLNKPYDLPQKKAIIELIKDITSLANNKGGYIVCGLTTKKRQNFPHDYVTALNLIKEDDFYTETQIKGLVSSNVYPRLEVKVKWFASKANDAIGLGVITVMPQDETKKYFIIKILEVDGEATREFFGVPVRTDDDTKWLSVQELHKLSKRSPNNFQELHQSLTTQIDGLKEIVLSTRMMSVNIDSIPAKIDETLYENE